MQLALVLQCFRRPQQAFPESVLYFKLCFSALRIASATYALGCCLVPICYYNYQIAQLAIQVTITHASPFDTQSHPVLCVLFTRAAGRHAAAVREQAHSSP